MPRSGSGSTRAVVVSLGGIVVVCGSVVCLRCVRSRPAAGLCVWEGSLAARCWAVSGVTDGVRVAPPLIFITAAVPPPTANTATAAAIASTGFFFAGPGGAHVPLARHPLQCPVQHRLELIREGQP